jgi:hypothetical protein
MLGLSFIEGKLNNIKIHIDIIEILCKIYLSQVTDY